LRQPSDPSLIERVLENLIGNALRHTPAGGRVAIALRGEGAQVAVEIADTGCGIAGAELPFIFDRFYRGDGAQRRGAGAGLGLAITKRILDLHCARIEVQSDASGTRFRFVLACFVSDAGRRMADRRNSEPGRRSSGREA
jgi:signal transduction histidine kinase